jgi:hypothetical protein
MHLEFTQAAKKTALYKDEQAKVRNKLKLLGKYD